MKQDDRTDRFASPLLDSAWGAMATTLTTWTLLSVALAKMGYFFLWTILPVTLLSLVAGWFFMRFQPSHIKRPSRRELIFLLLLIGAGLLLLCWPAEHFPQMGDASIYPNTAAAMIRTGGLTYHYTPLDGLSRTQKELFYIPSDEQLPNVTIEAYRGLLYGAYYVIDPAQNMIVSSRPTGAIAWMGLFGAFAGPSGMLYVASFFGVASLVTVYFIGKRSFDEGTGALGAFWLLLSFPQLHFSQRPYAEAVGQFFILTALFALLALWQTRRARWGILGIAALTAAFASRIDMVLALAFLIFFLMLLPLRFRWKTTGTMVAATAGGLGFSILTINRPYVGAAAQLMLAWQVAFLRDLGLIGGGVLGLVGLAALGVSIWLLRRLPRHLLRGVVRWTVPVVAILGVVTALHIRPMVPTVTSVGGEIIPTHDEELMAVAAQYLSPLFFWLAALGVGIIFWQRPLSWAPVLLLAFVLPFAGLFFWKYTTARVYPVALRRLLPEVLPTAALFAAHFVRRLGQRRKRRWAGLALAGLLTISLVNVSGPYWFRQEMDGAWQQIEGLADRIPEDAVVLFEPRQEGSIANWFAAPLWSFRNRRALLLEDQEPDEDLLRGAICTWQNQGREVFIVANQEPSDWWPGPFRAQKEGEITWSSRMIGQSLHFPPYVWRFRFTFSIYRWEGDACAPD
jgi:hypothetical protein